MLSDISVTASCRSLISMLVVLELTQEELAQRSLGTRNFW
jgi:hypothetical protein